MPHFGLVMFRYLNDHRQNVYLFNTATGTLIRDSQVVLGLLKAQQKAQRHMQQSLLCTFLLFDVRSFKKCVICRLLLYRVWRNAEIKKVTKRTKSFVFFLKQSQFSMTMTVYAHRNQVHR